MFDSCDAWRLNVRAAYPQGPARHRCERGYFDTNDLIEIVSDKFE